MQFLWLLDIFIFACVYADTLFPSKMTNAITKEQHIVKYSERSENFLRNYYGYGYYYTMSA